MPQNRRGNGNIYDLRQDLRRDPQRPAAPSQQSGTPAGSADGRYGFNGEPLSFKPDRTASGAPRRTRTDNSIAFPTQPRTERQSAPQRSRGQTKGRTAKPAATAASRKPAKPAPRTVQSAKVAAKPPRKSAAKPKAAANSAPPVRGDFVLVAGPTMQRTRRGCCCRWCRTWTCRPRPRPHAARCAASRAARTRRHPTAADSQQPHRKVCGGSQVAAR